MNKSKYVVVEFGKRVCFDDSEWDEAFDYWIESEDLDAVLEVIPVNNV